MNTLRSVTGNLIYKRSVLIFVLPVLVVFCSCSNGHIDTDEHIYSATKALVSEIESNGIGIKDSTVDLHLSGGPGSANIVICIDGFSEEKAQLIFEEVIFPYMAEDNTVVSQLLLVDGRVPEYSITISDAVGESYCSYTSSLDYGLEIWNDGEVEVYLEDYK